MIKHLIFDWGDTLMRDFPDKPGPMCNWDYVEVMQGVPEALLMLHERFTLSVASNAGQSDAVMLRKALMRVGIDMYFTHVFTSLELGFAKPALGFFKTIIEKLGTTPKNCCFIGNDYIKDIAGAKSAGFYTIYYKLQEERQNTDSADFIVEDFRLIQQISQKSVFCV